MLNDLPEERNQNPLRKECIRSLRAMLVHILHTAASAGWAWRSTRTRRVLGFKNPNQSVKHNFGACLKWSIIIIFCVTHSVRFQSWLSARCCRPVEKLILPPFGSWFVHCRTTWLFHFDRFLIVAMSTAAMWLQIRSSKKKRHGWKTGNNAQVGGRGIVHFSSRFVVQFLMSV